MVDLNLGVYIYSRNTATGAYNYIHYQIFSVFINLQLGTPPAANYSITSQPLYFNPSPPQVDQTGQSLIFTSNPSGRSRAQIGGREGKVPHPANISLKYLYAYPYQPIC